MGGHCLPIDPFYLGSRILMLGVSYKAGIGDTRESPALEDRRLGAARSRPARRTDPSRYSTGLPKGAW